MIFSGHTIEFLIIVNSSLANAIFPDDWNSARVTPPLCLIYVLRCLGNKKNFLKVSSVVHKSKYRGGATLAELEENVDVISI